MSRVVKYEVGYEMPDGYSFHWEVINEFDTYEEAEKWVLKFTETTRDLYIRKAFVMASKAVDGIKYLKSEKDK